jgi:molybdopterin molybdotransferase
MSILDAEGLTLCEDIVSDLNLPLVTTAQTAGFGLRASDIVGASPQSPASLFLVGAIAEGETPGMALASGTAIEVAEGALVPEGVDAVVPHSEAQVSGDQVHVIAEATYQQNLRLAGSELAEGTPLVSEGATLTPRSIAALAEVGYDKVLVRPRPRVVVITVGDHLVAPGQPLTAAYQRYDAVTALISAAASQCHANVSPMGVIRSESLQQVLADQLTRADLVVVVGGGAHAFEVVSRLGQLDQADVPINGVDRYGFAAIEDRVPVMLLPGGVVSAFLGYELFVRPVLARLNDAPVPTTPTAFGKMSEYYRSVEGVTEYVPAVLDADGDVTPVAGRGAELAHDLVRANVLAVIPDFWGEAGAGSEVQCLLLDPPR